MRFVCRAVRHCFLDKHSHPVFTHNTTGVYSSPLRLHPGRQGGFYYRAYIPAAGGFRRSRFFLYAGRNRHAFIGKWRLFTILPPAFVFLRALENEKENLFAAFGAFYMSFLRHGTVLTRYRHRPYAGRAFCLASVYFKGFFTHLCGTLCCPKNRGFV